MVYSGLLLLPLFFVFASAAKIPGSTTEMTVYRNASMSTQSNPSDAVCSSPSLTLRVPESLFIKHPVEAVVKFPAKASPIRRAKVASLYSLRPSSDLDTIEAAYLFLACLVIFAVINILIIDYVYGGPLFEDDSQPQNPTDTAPVAASLQLVRPALISASVPVVAAANPIHSAKWSASHIPKLTTRPCVAKPASTVKPMKATPKDGSDTEC